MPVAIYITKESFNNWLSASSWEKNVKKNVIQKFKTYRELKKAIKGMCEESIGADGVAVYRTRRGQWGEWFEHWDLDDNGKPYIKKEGWQ
jgi:hypothetical protein